MSGERDKKRVQAAAAAVIASAGILVNSALPSDEPGIMPTDDAPIVLTLSADDDGDELEEDEAVTDDEEKRRGVFARARAYMSRLPVWKRLLFLLPLWLIGWALIALAGSPVLGWLLTAALLALTLFAALKLAAPALPLRKLLCRRNRTVLLVGFLGTLTVGVLTDAVADGPLPGLLLRFVCSCVVLALVLVPLLCPEREEPLSPEEAAEISALEDELFEENDQL